VGRKKINPAIRWADRILKDNGVDKSSTMTSNFLDYADTVKMIVEGWEYRKQKRNLHFLEALKELRDDFEEIVKKDPACIYMPANPTALAFHKSLARSRYYHAANRTAKTTSADVDNYWVLTQQHPYRPLPPPGGSVFVLGTNYQTYGPKTFETKYVTGENANPLSPLFPEGGKWFHHYDERKHILTISCPDCAEKDRAMQCPGHHIKSTLTLYSDMGSPNAMSGAAFAQGHLDEQISYKFWAECLKRLNTVPNSGMVITETPIFGKAWWTYPVLKLAAAKPDNVVPGTNRPLVEVFTCSQFEGGLVPHSEIYADMKQMTEPEIRARVYGEHIAANEMMIFDATRLMEMHDETRPGVKGTLYIDAGTPEKPRLEDPNVPDCTPTVLLAAMKHTDNWIRYRSDSEGPLTIFDPPAKVEQYFISADVAKGLTKGDFSAADVYRIYLIGPLLAAEQVAQWHGHINSTEYGETLFKLGAFYNNACVIVERNGPGDATINKLRELGYFNLYQDLTSPSATRFSFDQFYGVDTNVASKPVMISMLKSMIKDKNTGQRSIIFRAKATIEEMENFIQEPSESGKTMTFHAAGIAKDDRVMSAAIGAYVLRTNPDAVYDVQLAAKLRQVEIEDTRDELTKKFWRGIKRGDTARKERERRMGR